jgi:undecaprenyl-diphosphatase
MSDIMQIILLAVVQGLTEFLPVSSSGHLVLIGHIIDFDEQGNMTEVILHVGTFIAVIIYFWKRILSIASGVIRREATAIQYFKALVVGSIPVVAVYFVAGDFIESLFDEPIWSGAFLCVTGLILLSLLVRRNTGLDVNSRRGFLIGLAQAVALLPGVSRSGSTIVAARHLQISPEKAAEFSFLMYLPAMAGAILIKSVDLIKGSETVETTPALVGILVSAVVGYAALALLLQVVKRGKLWVFGIYCLLAGITSIFLLH